MFKQGDLVEWAGVIGKVVEVTKDNRYPIVVNFAESRDPRLFTRDGCYFDWHKEPSLKLIERPEQKILLSWRQIEECSSTATSYDAFKAALGFKE